MNKAERKELLWVLAWAVLIVLLASLPYIKGALITPPSYSFTGLTHNIDDGAVYLSWMRQYADGHFLIKNLFTNEPQPALQFNLLFAAMGWFAAVTHLPLIAVFHMSRIVLGIAVILCIWQFSKLFLDEKQRRLLIPLVGLSSGIGWLIPHVLMPVGSVDVWQPEAITFLSIYLNPLFLAGLLLMIGALYWLEMMRREGNARFAVVAGLHLLILGNVHTYDVLTVGCVWAVYVLVLCVITRHLQVRIICLSALAAIIAVPSVAYQYHVYALDPVYRARANTMIASPQIWAFFEGYGIVLLGAIAGGFIMWTRARRNRRAGSSSLSIFRSPLLLVWSVVGFAIPYIPIAQQRKLVMGLHIPLCILCAYALSWLAAKLPGSLGRMVVMALVIFSAGTNAQFIALDLRLLNQGQTVTRFAAYLSGSELKAMKYLRTHAGNDDSVLAPSEFSLFTPAIAGVPVFCGHWSETPGYTDKLSECRALDNPNLSADDWLAIARDTGATYYVSETPRLDPPSALSKLIVKRFDSRGVRVYQVKHLNGEHK